MYLEWDRPVPPSWQHELEWLGGAPNRRVPWLLWRWEPGDVDREPLTGKRVVTPVQRYLIYEMIPPAFLVSPRHGPEAIVSAKLLLRQLNGPEPRSLRYWSQRRYTYRGSDGKPTRGTEWVRRSKAAVTQAQWELWRAWRCYAMPAWVLQGAAGGHKIHLSDVERQLARVAADKVGLEMEWPAPGDLPYTGWDRRAFNALAEQHELLELQRVQRDPERRTHEHFVAEQRSLKRTLQARLASWVDVQVKGAIDSLSTTQMRTLIDDAPAGREVTDERMAAAHEVFLDAGG